MFRIDSQTNPASKLSQAVIFLRRSGRSGTISRIVTAFAAIAA